MKIPVPSWRINALFTITLIPFSLMNAEDQKPKTPPSFLITQPAPEDSQPKSRQGIKEAMGNSMEEIIRTCADLQQELAQVQIYLSQVQTHLLGTVRELVDNTGPTKNAKKTDLREGLNVLQQA